jgi:uncharacterized protein (DUF2252 family)
MAQTQRRPRSAAAPATPAERAALGKRARAQTPRSSHADWAPAADRRDPVELLEEQAATRVTELVPIRYGRMLVTPFTFYRGGAYLMAADLAPGARTGLTVQLCGDAHLSNFGAFAAPDRRLVFSVNDFDETLPGPFEWDVKRLVASFAVAARDRGFDDRDRRRISRRVAGAYRGAVREFAGKRTMDIWYARLDVDDLVSQFRKAVTAKELRRFEANRAKAESKDSVKALNKLTSLRDGELRISGDLPLITPIEQLVPEDEQHTVDVRARRVIAAYRRTLSADRRRLIDRYHYVHAARKVVGVGSVGTRAWIALLLGRDSDDPLFLQIKEAQPSVLEPFLDTSEYDNHGRRVVEGQRLMQATSDILLGWVRTTGLDGSDRDFYVRQLWDAKGSALVDLMSPALMELYARFCGWTLARAHARSGDAIAIGSYLGSADTFDRAMAEFAEAYADQNERDHAALAEAAASGRVTAQAVL